MSGSCEVLNDMKTEEHVEEAVDLLHWHSIYGNWTVLSFLSSNIHYKLFGRINVLSKRLRLNTEHVSSSN